MKAREKIWIIFIVYLIGIPLGIIFYLFRIAGRIKVKGYLPVFEDGLILVFNHPSFLDPVLVILLYFPWCLFNPFRFLPIGVIAKEYYDLKGFLPFRAACVPVAKDGRANIRSFLLIKKGVREKRRICFSPEGGRTAKGEKFIYSEKGKRIRELKEGSGLLAITAGAKVLPIWFETEGSEFLSRRLSFREILKLLWQLIWKTKIIIKIGDLFEIQTKNRQEATLKIAQALLELADKEG